MADSRRLVLGLELQPVQPIEWCDCEPARWCPDQIPDVDDARPACCPQCLVPSRIGTRILLHGHGKRERQVVVVPAVDKDAVAQVAECWSRRYRCTQCGAVPTVLPTGVMPRFLYSAAAIMMAFLLAATKPVGDGLTDAEAYAKQGMYRRTAWTKPWPYQWRSIYRWAARISDWWPGRVAGSVEALLAGFASEAKDRQELLGRAIGSHACWGGAM